jgi:type IV secretory pathway TrbD component
VNYIEDNAHYTPHLPGCPDNGIHGITNCARCNEITTMPRPQPAAPALSISPAQPAKPVLASLPSRSGVWQRSYGPPATSPRPQALTTIPTRGRDTDDVHVGNIVYQALQRPKLLRGGEWQLSVLNNLVAAGFATLTIMKWNWRFALGAIFFGWGVQYLIRRLGRRDPKFWQKYTHTWGKPLIREPHGAPGAEAPAPRILPKQGWVIH